MKLKTDLPVSVVKMLRLRQNDSHLLCVGGNAMNFCNEILPIFFRVSLKKVYKFGTKWVKVNDDNLVCLGEHLKHLFILLINMQTVAVQHGWEAWLEKLFNIG